MNETYLATVVVGQLMLYKTENKYFYIIDTYENIKKQQKVLLWHRTFILKSVELQYRLLWNIMDQT